MSACVLQAFLSCSRVIREPCQSPLRPAHLASGHRRFLVMAQVQVDMGSVSREAMQCLDAAVKKFFDAHAADYKEVRRSPAQIVFRLACWK